MERLILEKTQRGRLIKDLKSSSIIISGKRDIYVCGVSAVVMW